MADTIDIREFGLWLLERTKHHRDNMRDNIAPSDHLAVAKEDGRTEFIREVTDYVMGKLKEQE